MSFLGECEIFNSTMSTDANKADHSPSVKFSQL